MREMHAPTSTSDLCWFASLLDREVPFQHEDVADGFALVQLLSMIAPSHVDLSWYATDEALQMVDLTPYNYRNLQQGLQSCSFLFTEQQQHILARLVSGTDSLPSAEAALQILSVLRSVYEQEHRAPSARLRSAAPTSPEGVLPADDQTEAVAYEPSESTFKPYLRWMLLFLTSHASAVQLEQLRIAECLAQIDCNVREIAPGPLIDLLCSGRLYQLLSDYIFPQGLPTPSRSGTDTSRSMEAVDMLMERGFLSFKKNVRDSIKEMIMDKSPFYETIHQKIIDAFMSADAQARIDVAQIVSHVQSPIHFQTGPLKFSPFDLEDGLLLWFNHVQAEARSRTDGAPPAYRAAVLSCDESDDLYHAFNHWKSWLMFCGFYCGPSSIHKHIMNLDECGADSEQAFDCIYSMLESEGFPTPAFRASEAAMFFGDDSISASSLASCKALLLAFLCELLAFVSQPACKISEDERSQSGVSESRERPQAQDPTAQNKVCNNISFGSSLSGSQIGISSNQALTGSRETQTRSDDLYPHDCSATDSNGRPGMDQGSIIRHTNTQQDGAASAVPIEGLQLDAGAIALMRHDAEGVVRNNKPLDTRCSRAELELDSFPNATGTTISSTSLLDIAPAESWVGSSRALPEQVQSDSVDSGAKCLQLENDAPDEILAQCSTQHPTEPETSVESIASQTRERGRGRSGGRRAAHSQTTQKPNKLQPKARILPAVTPDIDTESYEEVSACGRADVDEMPSKEQHHLCITPGESELPMYGASASTPKLRQRTDTSHRMVPSTIAVRDGPGVSLSLPSVLQVNAAPISIKRPVAPKKPADTLSIRLPPLRSSPVPLVAHIEQRNHAAAPASEPSDPGRKIYRRPRNSSHAMAADGSKSKLSQQHHELRSTSNASGGHVTVGRTEQSLPAATSRSKDKKKADKWETGTVDRAVIAAIEYSASAPTNITAGLGLSLEDSYAIRPWTEGASMIDLIQRHEYELQDDSSDDGDRNEFCTADDVDHNRSQSQESISLSTCVHDRELMSASVFVPLSQDDIEEQVQGLESDGIVEEVLESEDSETESNNDTPPGRRVKSSHHGGSQDAVENIDISSGISTIDEINHHGHKDGRALTFDDLGGHIGVDDIIAKEELENTPNHGTKRTMSSEPHIAKAAEPHLERHHGPRRAESIGSDDQGLSDVRTYSMEEAERIERSRSPSKAQANQAERTDIDADHPETSQQGLSPNKSKETKLSRRVKAALDLKEQQQYRLAEAEKKKEELRRLRLAEQQRKLEEKARKREEERARKAEERTRTEGTANVRSDEVKPARGKPGSAHEVSKRRQVRVTPSSQSNRQIVRNALMHVCLAGTVNEEIKREALEDLSESSAQHFVVLLRDRKNHGFRGLYSYDPHLEQILRVYAPPVAHAHSSAPDVLRQDDVLEFYKYDSGSREFKPIPTHSWGRSVHAVVIGASKRTQQPPKRH